MGVLEVLTPKIRECTEPPDGKTVSVVLYSLKNRSESTVVNNALTARDDDIFYENIPETILRNGVTMFL